MSSRIYPSLLYPPPNELSYVAHGHKMQTSSLRRSILRRTSNKFTSYGPKDGWADREANRLYTPFLLMVSYQKTQQFCSVQRMLESSSQYSRTASWLQKHHVVILSMNQQKEQGGDVSSQLPLPREFVPLSCDWLLAGHKPQNDQSWDFAHAAMLNMHNRMIDMHASHRLKTWFIDEEQSQLACSP